MVTWLPLVRGRLGEQRVSAATYHSTLQLVLKNISTPICRKLLYGHLQLALRELAVASAHFVHQTSFCLFRPLFLQVAFGAWLQHSIKRARAPFTNAPSSICGPSFPSEWILIVTLMLFFIILNSL